MGVSKGAGGAMEPTRPNTPTNTTQGARPGGLPELHGHEPLVALLPAHHAQSHALRPFQVDRALAAGVRAAGLGGGTARGGVQQGDGPREFPAAPDGGGVQVEKDGIGES